MSPLVVPLRMCVYAQMVNWRPAPTCDELGLVTGSTSSEVNMRALLQDEGITLIERITACGQWKGRAMDEED